MALQDVTNAIFPFPSQKQKSSSPNKNKNCIYLSSDSEDESDSIPIAPRRRLAHVNIIGSDSESSFGETSEEEVENENSSEYESSFIDDGSDSDSSDASLASQFKQLNVNNKEPPLVKCGILPKGSIPSERLSPAQRRTLPQQIIDTLVTFVFSRTWSKKEGIPVIPTITYKWSARLRKTAGRATSRRLQDSYFCEIELATKVLDTPEKLVDTIAHELCHMAVFCISQNRTDVHGPVFMKWMRRVGQIYPCVEHEDTKHSYAIEYKYRWRCSCCYRIYKRHSKSIDVGKQTCSRCADKGLTLVQIDKYGNDVKHKERQKTDWQLYVQKHLSEVRSRKKCSYGEAVKIIALMYKDEKKAKVASGDLLILDESDSDNDEWQECIT